MSHGFGALAGGLAGRIAAFVRMLAVPGIPLPATGDLLVLRSLRGLAGSSRACPSSYPPPSEVDDERPRSHR